MVVAFSVGRFVSCYFHLRLPILFEAFRFALLTRFFREANNKAPPNMSGNSTSLFLPFLVCATHILQHFSQHDACEHGRYRSEWTQIVFPPSSTTTQEWRITASSYFSPFARCELCLSRRGYDCTVIRVLFFISSLSLLLRLFNTSDCIHAPSVKTSTPSVLFFGDLGDSLYSGCMNHA
ncbi:uncharacterized protein EI97DRAFT_130164 [Westerdykella ornata]|uniref:Uncharacterized protein n=1 Tax=Westerdykella ornata TaxID=318751 RepID=A0A6A6JG50_WESOR|nr:uncharacterized protein EI97DRAFT_130164 [Westerdykella ornata]KAF2274179.1 hypothetical protein EI97DRAFT_130164 [Westerdykella ornata]